MHGRCVALLVARTVPYGMTRRRESLGVLDCGKERSGRPRRAGRSLVRVKSRTIYSNKRGRHDRFLDITQRVSRFRVARAFRLARSRRFSAERTRGGDTIVFWTLPKEHRVSGWPAPLGRPVRGALAPSVQVGATRSFFGHYPKGIAFPGGPRL